MESICLISSDLHEIERFTHNYPECIILSNILDADSLRMDNIKNVLSSIDVCVVGETTSFSDLFVDWILQICENFHKRIYNYHISVTSARKTLKKINLPIILVSSLLPDMGKSLIGLRIAEELKKDTNRVLFVSSNPMWQHYGCPVFPFEIIKSENPIYNLNDFLCEIINEWKAEILVLCVPGGIISSNKYNPFCDFGLVNYIIKNAITPTYILNCIHQNTSNINSIPEPFYPYKISRHIRTDRVLDQNDYDYYLLNRNVCINDEMVSEDEIPNVFDAKVYEKIAKEIKFIINNGKKND